MKISLRSKNNFKATYSIVLLIVMLGVSELANSASCVVTVNWSTGWCDICGGPTGNYACNPPYSGSGDWGPKNFTDCIPAGNILTDVCFTLLWTGCTGSVTLELNGTAIGTTFTDGSCPCGDCNTSTHCNSFPCPGGWPGYNYGGTNTINPVNNGTVCIDQASITLTYSPTTPPTPGGITGPTNPCAGSVQTYSISAVSGATGYTWSVPSGYTINSGQGTTSISVTIGTVTGNICVTANNSCGSSSPSCLTITPQTAPAAPGAITGTTSPCAGASVTYSIGSVSGATSYFWTVPSGWSIDGGQGTTSITVTVGTTSGNICVRASNACGNSSFTCLAISVTLPPAAPGAITGLSNPCEGTTQSYSISAVSGASSYQWTFPGDWTLVSGQGTTTLTLVVGASPGNICVRACNGCGCSAFTCMSVTPGLTPAVPGTISGPTTVCEGNSVTYSITAVPGATSYTWGAPSGWTFTGQGTISITATVGASSGNITVQACNTCGCSADQPLAVTVASLAITTSSTDESCDGGCDGTTSVPTITGGTSPYTYSWSGGCASSTCTALCAATYGVTVTDANGCTATGSATVNAGPSVVAGFTYNGNQCLSGNNFCFTNTGTSGATYSWDFGDGSALSPLENPCHVYTASGSYTVTQTVSLGACTDVFSTLVIVYTEPTASILGTDMSCNGVCDGTANLTVSSGLPPYTFAWSNGSTSEDLTGLCQGTYTVTVTDVNTCSVIESVNINEPVLLTVAMTGTNATCNGLCDGTATATASGGTGAYTYIWDDPLLQTNLIATGLCGSITYNVTVTDVNGCTVTGSQLITEPSAMVFTFSTVDATCGNNDGSACVIVIGGTSPYTYLWDDPGAQTDSCATALFGGGYNVLVTDNNGCSASGAVTVNTGASVTAGITDSTMVSCNGGNDGTATVTPGGGTTPYTYSWNTSPVQTDSIATGLSAGIWTATVLDAFGCSDAITVNITEPPILSAVILSSTEPSCNGDCDGDATVTVSGGTSPYTYSWSPTGGTSTTGTALCASILYTVTVTDIMGCITTASITLGEPAVLSLSVVGTNTSCNGGNNGSADLTVTGGTVGYNYIWSTGAISEDISILTAGSYCVTVTDLNGCNDNICVTISEPAALTLTTSSVDAYCALPNGSACVSVSGGTSPYIYLWDDPGAQTDSCATNVLGGNTYNVLVTDSNGCTGNAPVVVNDLPPGVASITLGNNASGAGICDGQATGSMSGGISPYTYLWDDPLAQTTATADSLCAGAVCITITDAAGCSSSDCITITEPAAITTSIIGTDIDCNGDCTGAADLTVTGGVLPYTYLWTPGGFTTEDIVGLCAGIYIIVVTDNNSISVTDSIVISEPLAIAITMGSNDAVCNGICDGNASGAVSGGTPPYSYLWDDSGAQTNSTATGLCAGSYVLTVTDSLGCTGTSPVTINEPVAMVITTSVVNATCGQSDGSATASVTNGISPLNYLWNDPLFQTTQTANNISSGTYQVVVTDSAGCVDSALAAVGDDAGVVTTIDSTTNVSCFGACDGGAIVSGSGGNTPYTYLWTPSGQTTPAAANLCAGIHIAQITDATGCVNSVSVTITEPADLIPVASSALDPSCNGQCNGTAQVVVTGGTSPYTYQWDDPGTQDTVVATGLCAGLYNVVVTDTNGCIATDGVTLTEPSALSVSFTTVDPGCAGGCNGSITATPSGGTTPYTYLWNDPGSQTTQIADSLCASSYSLSITDGNLCTFTSSISIFDPPALIASLFTSQDASCNGICDGFATVTQSGGTSPYTYLWSDGQTNPTAINLCTGSYNATVSDVNGCTDSITVAINQPTTLVLSITKTDVSCNGACDGTASVSVSGGTLPYVYQWDDPLFQTTALADSLCGGSYNVTVTDSLGCIAAAFSFPIIDPTAISINIISTTQSTCGLPNGGACVSVGGGVFPYFVQWNDPFVPFTIGMCIDSVFASVYTVYVLDAKGCFDSLLVPINDLLAPVIDSIITTDVNCYGDSNGTAEVYVSGATGTTTNVWKDPNGDTIAMGIGIISVSGLGGGTYSVTIIDDTTGCIVSGLVVINQPSPLTSNIQGTDIIDISCNGLCDGSLTVSVLGGSTPYSYSWAPTSTDIAALADSLCASLHIVVVTDAEGCKDSSSATITEPAAISATATITNITCFGGNDGIIDLLPTPTGGTQPYAYTWLPPGIAGNVPTATNLPAGTDTVIITDFRLCTDTLIATITEPTQLIIDTVTTVSDFCGSGLGSATVTASGGTPSYNYVWSTNPIQVDSSATGLTAGVYNITVTDASGCTATGPVTVPGTPGPIIDTAIVSDVGCFGSATGLAQILVSSGTLPFTYSWNTIPVQTTQTATGLSGGQYIATVTDSNGCMDNKIVNINEPDSITVLMFQDNYLICYGDSTQISVVVFGGNQPYIRSWDNGLPSASSHIVSPTDSTTYTVSITDSGGCNASGSVTVLVTEPLSITATSVEICLGQTGTVSAFPSSGNGGPYYVTWDDGTNTTTQTIVAGDSSFLSATPTTSILYTVIVSDSCSLNDTTQAVIAIGELPEVGFLADQNTGCIITFTDTSKSTTSMSQLSDTLIVTWMWDFGDGTIIGPDSGIITGSSNTSGLYNNPTHIYATSGVYTVTVTVTDTKGCSNTLTKSNMITVSLPVANFTASPNPASLTDPTVVFTDQTSGGTSPYTYSWNFDDPPSLPNNTSSQQNPTHTFTDTGNYNVLLAVLASDGCVDTIRITVTVSQEQVIYIPNIFSPDDIKENNMLYVSGVGVVDLSLIIYDRWGERIFENTSAVQRDRADGNGFTFGEGWDGTKKGKKLSAQVFVYYLKATFKDGEEVIKQGNITLVR